MSFTYLAFQNSGNPADSTNKHWNSISPDANAQALSDDSGAPSGMTFSYIGGSPTGLSGNGIDAVGTGDAAWVDEAKISFAGHYPSGEANAVFKLSGAPPNVDLGFHSSSPSSRVGELRVNGGEWVQFTPADDNERSSNFLGVPGVASDQGDITVEYRRASGSSPYLMAMFVSIPAGPEPTITITETELTPGGTISGTASNFTAAPTTISLSDGVSPALTPALTATASGDDYIFSALIPDFKALADTAGEGNPVQGLRIGTITATVE